MWKSILKTVAPILGTAIGGPFGGMASKFLIEKLGGDENTTEDQLHEMIENANPETLLKLKEIDADFKTEMKRLGIRKQELSNANTADARSMGIKTTLLPQMIISVIFITAFAVILYTAFTGLAEMAEQQKTIVNILLGILSAGVVQVMNFWFGSSSGSKEKDTPKL